MEERSVRLLRPQRPSRADAAAGPQPGRGQTCRSLSAERQGVQGAAKAGSENPSFVPLESELGYHGSMKTTVDIPESALKEVIRHTRAKTKRDAIVIAIDDFNRRKRLEKLAEQLGSFDNVMSREELLRLRETE
jgi:Bacterial antitoxin of type II TA system, VapB